MAFVIVSFFRRGLKGGSGVMVGGFVGVGFIFWFVFGVGLGDK